MADEKIYNVPADFEEKTLINESQYQAMYQR